MRHVFLTLALLLAFNAYADGFHVVELDEASVQYKKFQDGARSPLYFESTPKDEVDLRLNTSILKFFYFNNLVHGGTDQYQFHTVGWQYDIGLRAATWLDLSIHGHHSQHDLDTAYPYDRFPVEDSVGFTIYFFGGQNRGKALFQ